MVALSLVGSSLPLQSYSPLEADKQSRHFAERNLEIRTVSNKRVLWHLRGPGLFRVLNYADAARCFNLPKTGSPIATAAR